MAVTLRTIAEETGFAMSTISGVLNKNKASHASEATRRTIDETAQRLGYRPDWFARRLQQQRSFVVGIAGSLFGSEVIGLQVQKFTPLLEENGYTAFLSDTGSGPKKEKKAIVELCHMQAEGLILFTCLDAESLKEFIPSDMPHVLIAHTEIPGFHCLVIDRAAAMEKATLRLRSLGHKRIAFFTGGLEKNVEKLEGYQRALEPDGLFDRRLVFGIEKSSGKVREFIVDHAESFRDVTAVMASDDWVAIEIVHGLRRLGLETPADCSVVGFDDTEVAVSCDPTLTTLRQPRRELAARALEMLLAQLDNKPVENIILTPELIERGSTARCRDR